MTASKQNVPAIGSKERQARPWIAWPRVLTVLLLIGLTFSQCAIFNKKNRRVTNALDEVIQPKTTTSKVLLAPPTIVIGVASIGLDLVVVHPLSTIPSAVGDTFEWVWAEPSGGVVLQSFLLIPKLVLTPIVLVGDFVIRSLFDVSG